MLKKANRLKSRSGFKRTLAGRRVCANDCFVLYGLPAPHSDAGIAHEIPQSGQPRIGFIVSKKIHKRAVVRNRIRRRLRERVRLMLLGEQRWLLARFRMLVFIARSGSVEATSRQLQSRLEKCFKN